LNEDLNLEINLAVGGDKVLMDEQGNNYCRIGKNQIQNSRKLKEGRRHYKKGNVVYVNYI
jgi:hypothetical protein